MNPRVMGYGQSGLVADGRIAGQPASDEAQPTGQSGVSPRPSNVTSNSTPSIRRVIDASTGWTLPSSIGTAIGSADASEA
jgi:hypothetical protein